MVDSKRDRGQALVEFILLLSVLLTLALVMVRGFNGGIGQRWVQMINIIATPGGGPAQMN